MAAEEPNRANPAQLSIQGMTDLRQHIIELIGGSCVQYYNIQKSGLRA